MSDDGRAIQQLNISKKSFVAFEEGSMNEWRIELHAVSITVSNETGKGDYPLNRK